MLAASFTPFPEIRTERLRLRRILAADAPALLDLRTNDGVMRYLDREPPTGISDINDLIALIDKGIATDDAITWGICLETDPETIIGTIGYWSMTKAHYRAQLGYMLQPAHWRKGLMQEALKAVIRFGFDIMKLHSIEAHINPHNNASAAILEKHGFVREAYFREDYFFRGKFIDTAIYSLLTDKPQ